MSLAGSRTSIANSLKGIAGLAVYDYIPDSFNELPAVAIVELEPQYCPPEFGERIGELLGRVMAALREHQEGVRAIFEALFYGEGESVEGPEWLLEAEPGSEAAVAELVGRGFVDGAAVHPREVVREALDYNAAAVIFAHYVPRNIMSIMCPKSLCGFILHHTDLPNRFVV